MRDRVFFTLLCALTLGTLLSIAYLLFQKETAQSELLLYGNVDVRLVDIGSRVAGKVEKLFFEEGDWVQTGALLAVLEKNPYDSRAREAMAQVEAIKANFQNSEKLLQRRKELIGIGAISQEDLEDAEAKRDQLRADLLQAEAALKVQLDELSYTEVPAPTDGVILTRIREPGSVVNPGEPIYTLSVASPVWIRAFIEEPFLGKIAYGMKAEIATDSGRTYTGSVGFISPIAEFTPKTVETAQLRTDLVYRLRIYADNPDQGLKQGMPVTVKLWLLTGVVNR